MSELSEDVFIALVRECHPDLVIPPTADAEFTDRGKKYSIIRSSKSDLDVEKVMIKLIKEIDYETKYVIDYQQVG